MANTSVDIRSYFKLELLIVRSHSILQQLFKNRYTLFNGGQVWDDLPSCGNNYFTNVIKKNRKICLTAVQRTSVSSGNSNEWDLTTLTTLLINGDRSITLNNTEIQQLDNEDLLLKQLRDIRNTLAHHATKSVADVEFQQLWTQLTTILVAFGDVDSELDKLKEDTVFESHSQLLNEENVKEASRLKALGVHAYTEKNFADAIALFTKATVLPGVSDYDRAVLYSNMSSSRLALYEQQSGSSKMYEINDRADERYRALQDAKQARILWPTWWKAHFRVGKVYAILNEHEKAIHSFERASALAPANNEIQHALDDSRQIYARQSRYEYLDPRLKPRTMYEQLDDLEQKMGVDPEHVRVGHRLAEKMYPPGADVTKGHQYEHGDIDVKQDYEQAAKYFAKAASQGNAEGMYNLARLTDRGLGVKKDHLKAIKLYEQAAAQPHQHPIFKNVPNLGVAESEHALGLAYTEGVGVHKDLPTAAYWYERAIDHGSAQSANNLALMYLYGTGLNKNLDKAEQLLQLSSRRDDPNAMLTLANFLLDKNDFQMAKIWYDRACESGNIMAQTNRNAFEKTLDKKKQLVDHCLPSDLQKINVIQNVVDSIRPPGSVYKKSDKFYAYDYDVLEEHANRGSITAKNLCYAMEHYGQALYILMQSETLTEKQEDLFVHALSQCYRIEHIVARILGTEMRRKIEEIVDRALRRCTLESAATDSRPDEDARVCYAVLHMDSHELIARFLDQCKQKYPKSIYFFELSSAVHGWLQKYQAALYDAYCGLEIDPNYCELLYFKAVALRMLDNQTDEAIEAYRAFLTVAPEDHRKVPESYYAMASCYLVRHTHGGIPDIVKKTYKQGEEAEKLQLPCFLPYKSNFKTLLQPVIDSKFPPSAEAVPLVNRKLHLTNPHRIQVIKQHREWEAKLLQLDAKPGYNLMTISEKPAVTQQTAKSLIGLKPILLKEMNPTKNHVYNGHVLSVTIIEEACSWAPSIHLVVEDENLNCERMFIYGFPEDQGEYLTTTVFTIGSKMSIINPYLRLGANDMRSFIRVDDFSSIMMQNESRRVLNMCRCCGEPNAVHVCGSCQQARYCSKECQTMDWKVYQHKLICRKQ